MFDVSLSEILLIVVVAVVAIGPKELPVVLRTLAKWYRQAKGFLSEMRGGVDRLMQEAHIQELKEELKKDSMILDLQGNLQQTYDISDFLTPDTKVVDPGLRRDDGSAEVAPSPTTNIVVPANAGIHALASQTEEKP